ncbi:(2Fe-2S)-binding protein [Streptomyces sp. NBC_01016]|uniref:(2Fe-2S)-binding protein n=1 Tax=Streptomyces sp. NBC_01016 TaxID=2903720 RepID=UPI00225A0DFE|nr:(2Fe-2S)-binding protein [Streptomyces sp. NBC_01016]MCX4831801.1 (2Fe-2S)-binding protein [Streptomyces sp. NBC_01016]
MKSTDVTPEQVTEALRDVSRIGGFFALDTDPTQPSDADARLARAGFAERAQAVNDRYNTPEPRIGASIAHLGLAARLWSPVLACTLVHGIVPTMTTVEWSGEGSALRLPRPEGRRAAEFPSLADAVHSEVDGVLEAVESGFTTKVAPRLLAGNSASALVGSAAQLLGSRPELRTDLTRLTHELLETGRLRGTGRITGADLAFRRRSCCLFYRAPGGGKCGDCCLAR